PLYLSCAAAAHPEGPEVDSSDPSARMGTAVHSVLGIAIANPSEYSTGNGVADLAGTFAAIHDADADEVRILCRQAWRCWEQLREHFPNPASETYGEALFPGAGVRLTGHIDVFSLGDDEARILDWKTGFAGEGDHTGQLKGYGVLGLRKNPDIQTVRACLVRVREQTADWFAWTREELEEWGAGLAERLSAVKPRYSPGKHCGYCPRQLECVPRVVYMRNAVLALDALPVNPETLTGTQCTELLDRARLVESICADVRDIIKARVAAAGGMMLADDGRELVLIDQERKAIDPVAGWPVLRQHLAEDQIRGCATLAKGKVEGAISDSAPRGRKGKLVAEVLGELDQAGALVRTTIQRLEVRRQAPAIADSATEARIGGLRRL
ncbi:MAG: DUF2800 domain-containing protein, partial [Terriglobia bacterium]